MSLEAQLGIRNNAERLKRSVKDIHGWLDELKDKPARQSQKECIEKVELLKAQGNSRFGIKDFRGAVELYTDCLNLLGTSDAKPLKASIYLNRALSYFKLGRMSECVSDCKDSYKLCPSAKSMYRKALAEMESRHYRAARVSLRKSLALLSPNDEETQTLVNQHLEKLEELERALGEQAVDEARRLVCSKIPGWCTRSERLPLIPLKIVKEEEPKSTPEPVPEQDPMPVKPRYVPRIERMYPQIKV